jgi:hypothetical protein
VVTVWSPILNFCGTNDLWTTTTFQQQNNIPFSWDPNKGCHCTDYINIKNIFQWTWTRFFLQTFIHIHSIAFVMPIRSNLEPEKQKNKVVLVKPHTLIQRLKCCLLSFICQTIDRYCNCEWMNSSGFSIFLILLNIMWPIFILPCRWYQDKNLRIKVLNKAVRDYLICRKLSIIQHIQKIDF